MIDFVKNIDPTKTTIKASLPRFMIPSMPITLDNLKLILPFSFLAACVGLIESLMTLTLIDELTGTRGRSNRESIAQGLANITNGFFGGDGRLCDDGSEYDQYPWRRAWAVVGYFRGNVLINHPIVCLSVD